jgi:hypothetical protein
LLEAVDSSDEYPSRAAHEEFEAAEKKAMDAALSELPCLSCGSTKRPVKRKPRFGSASWWDDPSVYVGCADCGRYLADLPIVYPFIWQPDVED